MNALPQSTSADAEGASAQASTSSGRGSRRASLSVVMPTHNRAEMMAQVLRKTKDYAAGYHVEWIVVDDGSTDHTRSVLTELQHEIPNLTFRTVVNGGPGRARNLGASLAKNDVLLFIGDDILPANEDFFRPHAELHADYATKRLAVLGKVVWPSGNILDVNSVMRHIQGSGGEQFGYAHFRPYQFLDWRFFYTCNVSVKRDLVEDWLKDGFASQFTTYGFEDGEFAYRLTKQLGGFDVFYSPSSLAYHLHSYDVTGFIRRHAQAGAMANTLMEMHPELAPVIGVSDVHAAMQTPRSKGGPERSADYLAVIEGIKSWARILEHERRLGNEVWHDQLLAVAFEVAYLQGFLATAARANTNFEAGYARIMKRAKLRLARILDSEVHSDAAVQARLLALP